MKFSEMPYARPDLNELKQQLQALTDRLPHDAFDLPADILLTEARTLLF